MKQKNVRIFLLMLVTFLVYWFLNYGVVAELRLRESIYEHAQTSAYFHNIQEILPYRSPYLGDASNTGNLFYHLPLHQYPMTFAIEPETCTLTVHYDTAAKTVEKIRENLAYNTLAAMAAIDNLQCIQYEFQDGTYCITRQQVEERFDVPLSALLDDTEQWEKAAQHEIFLETVLAEWFPMEVDAPCSSDSQQV